MTGQPGEYAVTVTPAGAMLPAINMQMAHERRNQMVQFVQQIMVKDTDFGAVPGTDKPTLLKPGAERLKTFFGLTHDFDHLKTVEDWDKPFFYYLERCNLYRDGIRVGMGDGSCNSRESKYRYRQADRTCPNCKKATILRSRRRDNDKSQKPLGWFCWAKRGGCGATFEAGDKTIEGQETGRIENPDIADQVNTILKMAQKRALVAAVLITVNASEFFTQDVEDMVDGDTGEITTPPKAEQPKAAPTNGGQKSTAPPEPEGPGDPPTPTFTTDADLPTSGISLLNYVNERVQVPYDNVNHLREALRGEFGEPKWQWCAPMDTGCWQRALAAALKHANAKIQPTLAALADEPNAGVQ